MPFSAASSDALQATRVICHTRNAVSNGGNFQHFRVALRRQVEVSKPHDLGCRLASSYADDNRVIQIVVGQEARPTHCAAAPETALSARSLCTTELGHARQERDRRYCTPHIRPEGRPELSSNIRPRPSGDLSSPGTAGRSKPFRYEWVRAAYVIRLSRMAWVCAACPVCPSGLPCPVCPGGNRRHTIAAI